MGKQRPFVEALVMSRSYGLALGECDGRSMLGQFVNALLGHLTTELLFAGLWILDSTLAVSYTHLTLPTKFVV